MRASFNERAWLLWKKDLVEGAYAFVYALQNQLPAVLVHLKRWTSSARMQKTIKKHNHSCIASLGVDPDSIPFLDFARGITLGKQAASTAAHEFFQ